MDERAPPVLDVAIPVLNEERVLGVSVRRVLDHLSERRIDATLTIADNGSTDATPAIAASLSEADPRVRYVRVDRPALGEALREAWCSSRAPIVGYMDADLATDLRHLHEALAIVQSADSDMVIATRLAPGSRVFNRRLRRTVTSHVYNTILRLRLRYPGSDAACGFKFLTRSAWERIAANAQLCDGLFFGSEIAVRAYALGLAVREIPVDWTDERDSRIRVVSSAIDFWRQIGRLQRDLSEPRPARAEPP